MKIQFRGFLANVNSSIINLKLEHNFEINKISKDEGIELFQDMQKLSHMDFIGLIAQSEVLNLSEAKMYYIEKTFKDEFDRFTIPKSFYNLEKDYLMPLFRLLRLFKEGNIYLSIGYFCRPDIGKPVFLHEFPGLSSSFINVYKLEPSEISVLHNFLNSIKLPLSRPFIQLAVDIFELSYHIFDINMAFLSLIIALESLFVPSKESEKRYRIARNMAVLLGKNEKDTKEIFKEIRKMYDLRSEIVHAGQINLIDKEIFSKTRDYVRNSIKEIMKSKKEKESILELLNSCRFGDCLWNEK